MKDFQPVTDEYDGKIKEDPGASLIIKWKLKASTNNGDVSNPD